MERFENWSIERLRQEARRERIWANKPTEWPHHRQDYLRSAEEMEAEIERREKEHGAPPEA